MNMKKSLIAAAVTSACAVPMAAQADPVLWGEFVAGIEHQNAEARTGSDDPDGQLRAVLDTAAIGIETSEDLGNGLSVTAGTELDAAAGGTSGGDVELDNTFAALSGDFGSVLLGWGVDSAYYLHVQEAVDHGEIYDTYSLSAADTADDAIQYGYDGGAFQLTAEVQMNSEGLGSEETENFDTMALGASFDAGVVSIGVAHMTVNEADDDPEPSLTGVSVGGEFGGFALGAALQSVDPDEDDAPEPTTIDVTATTDLGGGLGLMLGFQNLDADTDDDEGNTTTINAQLSQALSERTYVFGQLQTQSIDGGDNGEDTDPQMIFVGLGHAF